VSISTPYCLFIYFAKLIIFRVILVSYVFYRKSKDITRKIIPSDLNGSQGTARELNESKRDRRGAREKDR